MVWWAAIAAGVVVGTAVGCIVAVAAWTRRRHKSLDHDALDYDDFVQLGRAAWVDLRDDDRTRLAK
jgi:hypothetical protein